MLCLSWIFPLCVALSAGSQGFQVKDLPPKVQRAVVRLQDWYDPQTGLWQDTGWWNSTNALTALIDYSHSIHSMQYESVLVQTYSLNVKGKFLNQYYDDEGWWALAWIDAYDLTGNTDYLRTAGSIFTDMKAG